MEERVEALAKQVPHPPQKPQSVWQQGQKLCHSKIGIAVLTFLFVFTLLMILQPMYIFKRNADNEHSLKHVNYALVLGLAAIVALVVTVVPYFIARRKPS